MTTRERNLAIVLSALILVGIGGTLGYVFVLQPIRQKNAAADKLRGEIDDLETKAAKARRDAPRLAETRRRSLPADENLARREYTEVLSRLLRRANVPPGYTIVSKPAADARTVPVLPGPAKKPAYTRVVTDIEFKKADTWAVEEFMTGFYKLNLLHQITAMSIKKDDDATGSGKSRGANDRKDLTVRLTTEAIILDGAEPRRTLLPVSTAFAGVGGWAGYQAVALTPEIGRGLTPLPFGPVLSTAGRDYRLLVVKDLFHGPLPSPAPLRVDKIADVSAEAEAPIPPVKVPVVADAGATGPVTLTARAEGKLLPAGAVKIDQTARTLTLTPAEGESGSATVTVVARAENGEEAKTSFKVSVKEPERDAVKPKEDIAGAIRLVITTTRSDGTASAVIRDNFNPLAYEIEADAGGTRVMKYFFAGPNKKPEVGYKNAPKPYLDISDDTSGTSRMFRVVAIDEAGLVLADLKAADSKPEGKAAAPPRPGGGRGMNPRGGKDVAPAGPADPLAAVVGSAGAAVHMQQPNLYRWPSGKSLATLTEIPRDEARVILRRVTEGGPVGATAAADSGPPTGN